MMRAARLFVYVKLIQGSYQSTSNWMPAPLTKVCAAEPGVPKMVRL